MEKLPILSIIVPCYNEEAVMLSTYNQLSTLLSEIVPRGTISEESNIVFVSDGSIDHTWEIVEKLYKENDNVQGINLAANVGIQNALLAGMVSMMESSDVMITIDADLQDDIQVIPQMISLYEQGNDIVYGVRRSRATDSWFKRTSALEFYKLMHNLGVKTVYNHADFRLMSKRAVAELARYSERNLFLRGIVPMIGYKSAEVYYDRSERLAGESKYSVGKMMNFAIDGITSFSVRPVRMIFVLGLVSLIIAIGVLIYVVTALVMNRTVEGWTSIMMSMWFIGGTILISLGIVGEYIAKIYIETKQRPMYNIEKRLYKKEDK